MNQKLNLDTWNRREHFLFFKNFDQPYYGVTVSVDCTKGYARAKELGVSFYSYYLHKILTAINNIDNFKYRINGDEVEICGQVDVSSTILRDDKTFGFSYIIYNADMQQFDQNVKAEIERVKNTTGLITTGPLENVIHFSALPWVNFTNISENFKKDAADSCPKVSVGKLTTDDNGKKQMPVAIHVHHALVDGYHLGLFFEQLQALLDG